MAAQADMLHGSVHIILFLRSATCLYWYPLAEEAAQVRVNQEALTASAEEAVRDLEVAQAAALLLEERVVELGVV
jgi:hypothetical protein